MPGSRRSRRPDAARKFASASPGPLVEPGPGPFTVDPGEDRILTVPNAITLARLCLLPVFVWLLLGRDDRVAAAALLAFLGATDWVDGWVARRFGQASRFGRMFDPTADRLMFFVAITAMIIDGGVPVWFAVVVLCREVVVGVITAVLVLSGNPPADVTWWGKAGTFGLMFAFPLLLAGAAVDFPPAPVFTVLGWVAGVPGLILSFIAFVRYFPLWAESLREGRILREARRR
jgi:cardiolipin synthase (CMP-forming)